MKITIDTTQDSKDEIKKVISFLNSVISQNGESVKSNTEYVSDGFKNDFVPEQGTMNLFGSDVSELSNNSNISLNGQISNAQHNQMQTQNYNSNSQYQNYKGQQYVAQNNQNNNSNNGINNNQNINSDNQYDSQYQDDDSDDDGKPQKNNGIRIIEY